MRPATERASAMSDSVPPSPLLWARSRIRHIFDRDDEQQRPEDQRQDADTPLRSYDSVAARLGRSTRGTRRAGWCRCRHDHADGAERQSPEASCRDPWHCWSCHGGHPAGRLKAADAAARIASGRVAEFGGIRREPNVASWLVLKWNFPHRKRKRRALSNLGRRLSLSNKGDIGDCRFYLAVFDHFTNG